MLEVIELSHTRINDLLCPWRCQRLYIFGDVEPDSIDSLMGVLLHRVAMKYGRYLERKGYYKDFRRYKEILDAEVRAKADEIDLEMCDQIENVGAKFADGWSLDKDADSHNFEVRLYVDRDGHPVTDPNLLRHPTCDLLAGTPDHVAFLDGGRRAKVEDYKMGFRMFDYDAATTDDQLLLYAWLLYCHYPQLEEIVVRKYAPMFNCDSLYAVRTELLYELVRERVEGAWARVDSLRAEYGTDKPWPVTPDWSVCKWCKLACPRVPVIVEVYRERLAA